MNKAIVLGGECDNTLGQVQGLGKEGVYVIAVLTCKKSNFIRHSNYVNEIFCVESFEHGIDTILEKCVFEEPAVIFAAGDGAAYSIERNKERLKGKFLFEYIEGKENIEFYMHKQNQVAKANEFNFNVPKSLKFKKGATAPSNIDYPCIVKPLVSCESDKRDIQVAENEDELNDILQNKLRFSDDILIQQFIKKDYEYNMLGCSYSDGSVYIPLSIRKIKFSHHLSEATAVTLVGPCDPEISKECEKIKAILKSIGYVGLFSVEFMHSKIDNKIYFTEINFRNDGLDGIILHCGVNLPYLHYQDLCGKEKKTYKPISETKKYICESNHFSGLIRNDQPFLQWLSDFKHVDGFVTYFKDDKKPFIFAFANKFLSLLHLL